MKIHSTLIALFVSIAAISTAHAQATRTWVSGVGDDANPCSRTAPCKTFAGAISKTAAKGEINVLDPGGFGALTITKAITIDGHGNLSGVLTNAANAINISAAVGDKVVLRNLVIDGLGTATNGIRVNSASMVIIQDCKIFGFANSGIALNQNHPLARALVVDCAIYQNGTGIFVQPGASGVARATIRSSHIDDNGDGVVVNSASGGTAVAHIVNSKITDSGLSPSDTGIGLSATGAAATARITGNEIQANKVGLQVSSGGAILSAGDNNVFGNAVDGNPTGTFGKR